MSATEPSRTGRENVILIHWHDLGRHLGCYGADDVVSPHLDRLAAEGIRFTDAHATAPLCSPARGSIFTGRYPHGNGLVGLAHHGFGYLPGVRTLPAVLSDAGYRTALFGMQHESADPSTLGFDSVDVSDSRCDYVVDRSSDWLREYAGDGPFLLTAGFFETHRPYPVERYTPADTASIRVPGFLPDTPEVRDDLAGLYGSIEQADAAVGRLLATVEELGLAATTWIVFFTDHGLAFPRAKSTLYAEGTGIALIVRPPRSRGVAPRGYEDLFSGVDLTPTILDLLDVTVPPEIDGTSHAAALVEAPEQPVRSEVFSEKTYHDAFDPIRAVRTKRFSYIENYVDGPALLLPLDIADSSSARSLDPTQTTAPRPARELYDLSTDPHERHNLADDPRYGAVVEELGAALAQWRRSTGDVLPDPEVGEAIARRFMARFHAAAADAERPEEALRSRQPEGARRGPAPARSGADRQPSRYISGRQSKEFHSHRV